MKRQIKQSRKPWKLFAISILPLVMLFMGLLIANKVYASPQPIFPYPPNNSGPNGDVAISGPNAVDNAPEADFEITTVASYSGKVDITLVGACVVITAGNPGLSATITSGPNAGTSLNTNTGPCVNSGQDLVFHNISMGGPASQYNGQLRTLYLQVNKINGQGHQSFRVQVKGTSSGSQASVSFEGDPNRFNTSFSGFSGNAFGVWPSYQTHIRFETPCTYIGQPVFFKWQNVEYGATYQSSSIQVTIQEYDSIGNPARSWTIPSSALGSSPGQQVAWPASGIVLKPGYSYDWVWTNAAGINAIQFLAPFSENSYDMNIDCAQPQGNVVSAQTNCSQMVLNAYDGILPGQGADFAVYHVNSSNKLSFDFQGYTNNSSNTAYGLGSSHPAYDINYNSLSTAQVASMLTSDFTSGGGSATFYLMMFDNEDYNWYWVMQNPPGNTQYFHPNTTLNYNGLYPSSTMKLPSASNLGKTVSASCGGGSLCSTAPGTPAAKVCTAQCAVTGVTGTGPGGIVLPNTTMTVNVSYQNTNPNYYLVNSGTNLYLDSGGITASSGFNGNQAYNHNSAWPYTSNNIYNYPTTGPHQYSPDSFGHAAPGTWALAPYGTPGDTVTYSFTIPSPTTLTAVGIPNFMHPSIHGANGRPIGNPCGILFDTYQPFSLNHGATGTLTNNGVVTNENPNTYTYSTFVSNSGTIPVKNDPQISCAYHKPSTACGTGYATSGSVGPGSSNGWGTANPIISGNAPIASPVPGDNYCVELHLLFSTGYVDAYGNATQTNQPSSGFAVNDGGCLPVVNEPYFKVFGSSVMGGYGICNSPASASGEVAGWNDDSGQYPGAGSGSQLGVLALTQIAGVTSAQNTSNGSYNSGGSNSGIYATFANSGVTTSGTPYQDSPLLGGSMSSSSAYCTAAINPPSGNPSPGNAGVDIGTTASGTNPVFYYNGPVVINPSSVAKISAGSTVFFYVNGDAYINNNITYDTSSAWNVSNVPYFVLVASGNIYIDPAVTQLDGLYQAQPNTSTPPRNPPGTTGHIYTCATNSGYNFQPMSSGNLFGSCNNQLTINGSFVADEVDLMRTYGSLRNSRNNENVNAPTSPPSACSNGGSTSSCASELFNLSPELYMANSPTIPLQNGGALQYKSYTSLPPVL